MTEPIDEKDILDKILKFDEFGRFYEKEWNPRKERGVSIDWYINPTIEHYAIQDYDVDAHKPYICLQHLPETIDDAFLVAHEITHVILDLDNKCLRIQINETIARDYGRDVILDMARRLGSMLDDPRVDSFLLRKYSLNPSNFYAKIKLTNAIKGLTPSSEGKLDLIRWNQAMFYSQTKLQCDLVKDDEVARKWKELENLYQKNRPNVKRIGDELYTLAKENGYDTLEKQKSLLGKITGKYTIDDIKLNNILRASE